MRNRWFAIFLFTCSFLTGCSSHSGAWQGYVEGRFRYIASNFSGVLEQLWVQRGASVKVGQALFVLEQQPESDQLKQAEAQENQSAAAFALTQLTLKRQETLLIKGNTEQATVDAARTDFQKAQANLFAAQATLRQAQWSQAQKAVNAEENAVVFDTYYLPGELVTAGQPVLSLLAPQDIKVIFYVSEPQLGAIQLGQKVQVSCDGCKDTIDATISFISPQAEYTPPVIYSNDTRAKLVFRVEAAPAAADAMKLHPGQPVEVVSK